MPQKVGIGGGPNTGKSYGRRYIPDGENVMIVAPSLKSSHLFESMEGIEKMSREQIDKAIETGKRKPVSYFDIVSPEGKYKSIQEAIKLPPNTANQNVAYFLNMLLEKKSPDYFGKTIEEKRKHLKGNILLCEDLSYLQMYMRFVNDFMPWIHTIILPDFTHYITQVITSPAFLNRKAGNEAFARYMDLAADSLRSFIKYADKMRNEVIVITEYHTDYDEPSNSYKIFTPGGKMLTDKFKPTSYYDTFIMTDVKYQENEEDMPEYRFVTRTVSKYPEARSIGGFESLYIENDLQEVLSRVRKYNGIELK